MKGSVASAMSFIDGHLSITWLMQQNPSRIQITVLDRSPTKWLEFVVKFKDYVHDLKLLTHKE